MKSNSLVIIGCGDLGVRTASLLARPGFAITGVCRHPGGLSEGLTGHSADYCQPGSLDFLESLAPAVVLVTLKPTQFSEIGYQAGFPGAMKNLLRGLGEHRPRLIAMVSSTRVYAEQNGGWVEEDSPLAQEGYAARAIIEAEQLLQNSGQASCIVRCGGIYGGPRGRLLSRIACGEVVSPSPLRYCNRIHRDDCAGLLSHLIGLEENSREPVYVAVDDEPAPQHEVELWLREQLGAAESPSVQPASERSGGHKRCSNRLMRASGYTLRYPDYRAGYGEVLKTRERESPQPQ